MKLKYTILPLIFILTACNVDRIEPSESLNESSVNSEQLYESSSSEVLVPSEPSLVDPTDEPTDEPSTPVVPSESEPETPSASEPEQSSEPSEVPSSEPTDESTEEPSEVPSIPSDEPSEPTDNIIDVSEKEYYKSLVNRSNLIYSDDFVNDPTHDVKAIEIFQLNDTHGAYYDEEEIVGISRVADCIKENTVDPYSVVKIANGDMLQGTAFSNMLLGEPGIAALNELNFDAFVIGNHEFDWSIDNLSVYKDGDYSNGELDCPFLGANILNGDNERPSWIEPYTVVEKGNVKVGIIGVIGNGLESSISKVALGKYHFSNTVDAVNKYSKILLEEENVDIIIVGDHNHSQYNNQQYVDNSEVDAIINGHDHWRVEETVNRFDGKTIPVIESNTKNESIGKITLNLDSNKDMSSYSMRHYYPSSYDEDLNMKALMDVYYKVTGEYQNTVIGYYEGGMDKATIGISTCTYIADKYDADIAMMNTGGVRSSILSSNITNGLIYEALPFDNELYIATLTGSELKKITNGSGYYYNNSGIAMGTTVLPSRIETSKTYKVVCVDYVATKTYFQNFFNEEHGLIKTGDYIRDCALENIKINYPVNS